MDNNKFGLENKNDSKSRAKLQQEFEIICRIKYAHYLVPCKAGNDERSNQTEFAVFVGPTGERFIPVFTKPDELNKWPFGHDKTVRLSFDDLKYIVLNDRYRLSGIIIDPFDKMVFLRQEQMELIDLVTEGIGFHNVKHSNDIQLSKPAQEPAHLNDELKLFFGGLDNVYKAYILMAKEPADLESHLLIVVDFDGNKSDLFPPLAKIISENLDKGETFEMMKATYNLLEMVTPINDPIYIRC